MVLAGAELETLVSEPHALITRPPQIDKIYYNLRYEIQNAFCDVTTYSTHMLKE